MIARYVLNIITVLWELIVGLDILASLEHIALLAQLGPYSAPQENGAIKSIRMVKILSFSKIALKTFIVLLVLLFL